MVNKRFIIVDAFIRKSDSDQSRRNLEDRRRKMEAETRKTPQSVAKPYL